jgi:hypothetical protein
MRRSRIIAAGIAACAAASLGSSGVAAAAFPDFSDCPKTTPNISSCVHLQSRSGHLTIKGFEVPIGESFQLRGASVTDDTSPSGFRFVPPRGTTGVFSKPIQVPGGLLGINFPLPGNAVTATAKLAGPVSNINFDPGNIELRIPLKLALTNPIIGPGCQIGSDSNPVRLDLIVGTTAPPAPNRPITGRVGDFVFESNYLGLIGNVNVDNSFSVPGASGCGIGLGLINSVVNLKLKLPAAGGNNEIVIGNDVALGGL